MRVLRSLSLSAAQSLVATVPIETLASIVAGDRYNSVCEYDSFDGHHFHFVCPNCHHRDINAPSGRVLDDETWSCGRCKVEGTRWMLERLVIEDARLLERLADWLSAA